MNIHAVTNSMLNKFWKHDQMHNIEKGIQTARTSKVHQQINKDNPITTSKET